MALFGLLLTKCGHDSSTHHKVALDRIPVARAELIRNMSETVTTILIWVQYTITYFEAITYLPESSNFYDTGNLPEPPIYRLQQRSKATRPVQNLYSTKLYMKVHYEQLDSSCYNELFITFSFMCPSNRYFKRNSICLQRLLLKLSIKLLYHVILT